MMLLHAKSNVTATRLNADAATPFAFLQYFSSKSVLLSFLFTIFAFRMETDNSIESQIATVLSDIHLKGYSSAQPFSIGKVEQRMLSFAQANTVTLASDELYMSAKQLQHCMRASKNAKGLVVADVDLIGFPQNRFQMDLYYDGECFIYTDGKSKFIVHPNYQMKVSREIVKLVNFITATRRTDKKEFNGKRYIKIQ